MSKIGYKETIDWYNQNASQYAQKSTQHSSIDKQQLEDFSSRIPSGARVLDAGCGAGRDTKLFDDKGYKVTGLDISQKLLLEARKRYPNLDFIKGNLLDLPFANNTFGAVWAHAAIVHFEKDIQVENALSEFHRTLKEGGIIHILVRAQKRNGKKNEVVTDCISRGKRFFRNFTKKEIKKLMSSAGFKDLEINQYSESNLDPKKRPGENIEWIIISAKK